jgi:hypothetical protein
MKSSIGADGAPDLVLAFGLEDRFVSSQELLAKALPPARVFRAPGGHRWPTWRALWDKVLASSVLSESSGHSSRPSTPSGRSH